MVNKFQAGVAVSRRALRETLIGRRSQTGASDGASLDQLNTEKDLALEHAQAKPPHVKASIGNSMDRIAPDVLASLHAQGIAVTVGPNRQNAGIESSPLVSQLTAGLDPASKKELVDTLTQKLQTLESIQGKPEAERTPAEQARSEDIAKAEQRFTNGTSTALLEREADHVNKQQKHLQELQKADTKLAAASSKDELVSALALYANIAADEPEMESRPKPDASLPTLTDAQEEKIRQHRAGKSKEAQHILSQDNPEAFKQEQIEGLVQDVYKEAHDAAADAAHEAAKTAAHDAGEPEPPRPAGNADIATGHLQHQIDETRSSLERAADSGEVSIAKTNNGSVLSINAIGGDGTGIRDLPPHPRPKMPVINHDLTSGGNNALHDAVNGFTQANEDQHKAQEELVSAYKEARKHEDGSEDISAVGAHIAHDKLAAAQKAYDKASAVQAKASKELYEAADLGNANAVNQVTTFLRSGSDDALACQQALSRGLEGKELNKFAKATDMKADNGKDVAGKLSLTKDTFGSNFRKNLFKKYPLTVGLFMFVCWAISKATGKGFGCWENVNKVTTDERFQMIDKFMKTPEGADLSKITGGVELQNRGGSSPKFVVANPEKFKQDYKQRLKAWKDGGKKGEAPLTLSKAEDICAQATKKFDQFVGKQVEEAKADALKDQHGEGKGVDAKPSDETKETGGPADKPAAVSATTDNPTGANAALPRGRDEKESPISGPGHGQGGNPDAPITPPESRKPAANAATGQHSARVPTT
ncbi:MAG: hypothetical protein P1U34_03655 [Coxiellaceae bacterium]|nr:hypothetical protein [Coxiellaceae bacterium]